MSWLGARRERMALRHRDACMPAQRKCVGDIKMARKAEILSDARPRGERRVIVKVRRRLGVAASFVVGESIC